MLLEQGVKRSRAARPRLKTVVLGGEGVLFRSRIGDFLSLLATSHQRSVAEIEARWEREVRTRYWRGEMTDAHALRTLTGSRSELSKFQHPLALYTAGPAMTRLYAWSARLDVWLLCNHRSSWLRPFLEEHEALGALSAVRISDETALLKPEPEAFHQLLPSLRPQETLVVDSRLRSVSVASSCGFRTLQARDGNDWVAQIDAQIEAATSEPERLRA